VAAKESDSQDACLILYARNQSVIVALDIEYHSTALENAGFRIRALDILGYAPLRTTYNREPGIILRTCRFDSLVAGVGLEVVLDDLGTNDEHLLDYATNFQKLEAG